MVGVALEIDRGAGLQLRGDGRHARAVHDGVDIEMPGDVREQFLARPGEDVHDARGHVARREHLGERERGQRMFRRGNDNGGVAAENHRREQRHEREQHRLVRREHDDDARRLGRGEVEVRRRHRVHAAEDLLIFVRPARVMHEAVDHAAHARAGLLERDAVRAGDFARQFLAAALEHLGGAIEDLPAQIRGGPGPARERRARGDHGIAEILARRAAVIVQRVAAVAARGEHAAAFTAHEFAADEKFVSLANSEARFHAAIKRAAAGERKAKGKRKKCGELEVMA